MKWPWVSRRAYDEVCADRDWTREVLRQHILHALGVKTTQVRAEAGLPETPREPKERDKMPRTLRDKIMKFGSVIVQQDLLSRAERRREQLPSWVEVEAEFDAGMVARDE